MSESKQLLDKHEENVDSITGQRDAHLAGTDMGNGSAPACRKGKDYYR